MAIGSWFKDDSKLALREQALIAYAVQAALKNEQGKKDIRQRAIVGGLSAELLEQVDDVVESIRGGADSEQSLDAAIAQAMGSSCCS